MHETKERVFHVLTCLISSLLYATAGNAERSHADYRVNHTRGNSPVSEFRTHMLRAISTLSVSRQCTILTAILQDSGENPSRVMQEFMDTVPYQHLPCVPMTSPSGSSVNTSELRRATDHYITRLFNNLPHAFQCKIISDVTFAPRGDVTKGALTDTMSKISKKLNLEKMTENCADTTNPREIITNTYVQVGVRLRKAIPLEAWLERFRKILPTIYLSYVSKTGRVAEFVSGWTKNKQGAKIPVISPNQFLVKIQNEPVTDGSVAMISFSLFSRTKLGDYRLISGDEVAASFDDIDRSVLNSYIQAEVIGWRSHAERDNARSEKRRNRKSRPSDLENFRLQNSFPKYLVKFFKSMTSNGRCYILQQISSYVEKDLLVVEKYYHALGLLPKKYYCSRAAKYDSRLKSKRPRPLASVWDRLDKFIQTTLQPTPTVSTTILPARNSTVIRETRPFNSMEIVMFALLCFLCLLIMVFVANCVVFTFKTKQLNSKYSTDFQTPQVVFGDTGETKDCGIKTGERPPGKLSLTDNPQPEPSMYSGGQNSRGNHQWRLLSMTSEGGETVCSDVMNLSDDGEPERVSSV